MRFFFVAMGSPERDNADCGAAPHPHQGEICTFDNRGGFPSTFTETRRRNVHRGSSIKKSPSGAEIEAAISYRFDTLILIRLKDHCFMERCVYTICSTQSLQFLLAEGKESYGNSPLLRGTERADAAAVSAAA